MNLSDDLKLTIQGLDCRGVHNFSFGVLDSYFKINDQLLKDQAQLLNGRILVLSNIRNPKAFVFKRDDSDLEALKLLQERVTIYSIDQLSLQKESKFTEIVYDLEKVFDKASYPNAKKRHQHLTYPFSWAKKLGVEVVSIDFVEMDEIKSLHDEWVKFKMDQPGVYRMMFPTGRYLRVCSNALKRKDKEEVGFFVADDDPVPISYIGYGFLINHSLGAVRVLSQQGEYAFDLAFFGRTWELPSNSMEHFETISLSMMNDLGIKFVNCGAQLDKNLRAFKSHLPSFEKISFMYGKAK
jgi:hypothetical protein